MTRVWPALWPPWKRTTMSACSDNQSTILPFPSSPHWAPTTTTLAIRGYSLCNHLHTSTTCAKKPALALPDHAPSRNRGRGPLACEALHRIKEAGYRRKQERGAEAALGEPQAFDIPGKFVS